MLKVLKGDPFLEAKCFHHEGWVDRLRPRTCPTSSRGGGEIESETKKTTTPPRTTGYRRCCVGALEAESRFMNVLWSTHRLLRVESGDGYHFRTFDTSTPTSSGYCLSILPKIAWYIGIILGLATRDIACVSRDISRNISCDIMYHTKPHPGIQNKICTV